MSEFIQDTNLKDLDGKSLVPKENRMAPDNIDIADIIAKSKDVRGPRLSKNPIQPVFVEALPNANWKEGDPIEEAYGMWCMPRRISGDEEIMIAFRSRASDNVTNKEKSEMSDILAGQANMTADEIASRWSIALWLHYGLKAPQISLRSAIKMMAWTEDKEGVDGREIMTPLYDAIMSANMQTSGEKISDADLNILNNPEIFGQMYVAFRNNKLIEYLGGDEKTVTVIRNNLMLIKEAIKYFDEMEDGRNFVTVARGTGNLSNKDYEEAKREANEQG